MKSGFDCVTSMNGAIASMINPLLEKFREINDLTDLHRFDVVRYYEIRDLLRSKYGYGILDQGAIDAIVAHSPILEVGAGTGYNAWLLEQAGAMVDAYDVQHPLDNPRFLVGPYVNINIGDVEFDSPEKRALLLSWPPASDMASLHTRAYLDNEGCCVIYIGEQRGGCTADAAFFDLMDEEMNTIYMTDIPRWWDMCDYMCIYER